MAEDQQQTDKTPAELSDRVWELAKKIDICMFNTWDGERQQSRPLSSRVLKDDAVIYFLVDAEGEKNAEIAQYPEVTLSYTDSASHKYVFLAGRAELSNDRMKIKELWSDFDKAWWDDENDPAIRLLTFIPSEAELWDSPNQIVAFTTMLAAAVTGAKPKFGDHGTVRL
jgi:general stress protein 26